MEVLNQLDYIHGINWNYLIILDACRYDYFVEYWEGETEPLEVYSPASTTYKWLEVTFPNFYNFTVYSSNPFINSFGVGWSYKAKDHFKKIVDLWKTDWDEKYGTVLPENVVSKTKNASPRSIIWFLQPHFPYISCPIPNLTPQKLISHSFVEELKLLKKGYEDNVILVLRCVDELIEYLEPPLLITSDHGELLGEYGLYGHPNLSLPELRQVPLVVKVR